MGYATQELSADTWYMLAPQFNDVAAIDETTIDLLKVAKFEGLVAKPWAQNASASQIKIIDPATGGYTTYYYITGAGGIGWRMNPAAPTKLPVKVGVGVWFKVAEASGTPSITISGQVKEGASSTTTVGDKGEWQIICNPFPVDLTIGKLTTSGLIAKPWAQNASAPQIKVIIPSTGGYTTYYYITGAGGTQWRKNPAAPAATEKICGVGEAFWVKAPEEGVLTFSL